MTQILGVIFEGILGLVANAVKSLWYSHKLSEAKSYGNKMESNWKSERTKTHLLIKKAESKMQLRKNLDKIAHPSRNLAEYIERDKKL